MFSKWKFFISHHFWPQVFRAGFMTRNWSFSLLINPLSLSFSLSGALLPLVTLFTFKFYSQVKLIISARCCCCCCCLKQLSRKKMREIYSTLRRLITYLFIVPNSFTFKSIWYWIIFLVMIVISVHAAEVGFEPTDLWTLHRTNTAALVNKMQMLKLNFFIFGLYGML